MSHLRGARQLFQTWSAEQSLLDEHGAVGILDRDQSFIVGSMAYWETLAAFITDQSGESVDYLTPFATLAEGQTVYPHAWAGVSTPIFIYMARVGILLRQKIMLQKLTFLRRGSVVKSELDADLIHDAKELYDKVLAYSLPPIECMEETGDECTPLSHLIDVAKIYRFVALLELFQAFPSLAASVAAAAATTTPSPSRAHPAPPPSSRDVSIDELIYDLATSITTIISDFPRESGVFTVLCIALISAGSALQSDPTTSRAITRLTDELHLVRRGKAGVAGWRHIMREQIMHTRRKLGLAAVHRVAKLVQEVWSRSDVQTGLGGTSADSSPGSPSMVHWMDVMIDLRIETLFG